MLHMQQRFQLNDVSDRLPFFSEFELLVTAIGHYRRCYLDLVPHMQRLQAELRALAEPDSERNAAMLAQVARSLGQTMSLVETFFQAFDVSFDAIVSNAEPRTFRLLHEYLQGAYATIGVLLCGWGLRLQALSASTQRRRSPTGFARTDVIREVVCKHLDQSHADIGALRYATEFLRQAAEG